MFTAVSLFAGTQRPLCPFADPNLDASDPAEVAWAAVAAMGRPELSPAEVGALRTGIARMIAGNTEEHARALTHLLQTAVKHELRLPAEELPARPQDPARIPWLYLQARVAADSGGRLLALFQGCDSGDASWEFLGGELAGRGHRAFAIELRTRQPLRLYVYVGRRVPTWSELPPAAPQPQPAVPRIEGFPEPLISFWKRDKTSLLVPDARLASSRPDGEVRLGEAAANRARLRWLARLGLEGDPLAWARRFDALCRETQVAGLAGVVTAARQRATAALDAVDAGLRQRFRVPQKFVFPPLEVVVVDLRLEREKKAQPLPEWK